MLECPPEYEAELRALYGADFADELRAMLAEATLDLRVNTLHATREEAQESLTKDGVNTAPTPYASAGLRALGKVYLAPTKAFKKGWIDIQDEGSQLIADVCGATPGLQVLDYCAGGGGKTLALAAAMKKKGRIVAMDLEKSRLEKARLRFRRAGVADIIEVRPLTEERHRRWLRRQKGTFDIALADVPCTGSGTWRRNPDLRWRTYGPARAALLETQREILARLAPTVKIGGKLVYATCSLFRAENEDQIDAFLAAHPEFSLSDLSSAWPGQGRNPCAGAMMRLSPYRHSTDGFFAAVLTRVS